MIKSSQRLQARHVLVALFILLGPLSYTTEAMSGRDPSTTHGRFALGYYSIDDSVDNGDISATQLYYRVIGDQLAGFDNISFNVDGRYRSASTDYNENIPTNRLLMANVQIKNLFDNHLEIAVGRSFIKELVSQNVDGVDARFRFSQHAGVGAFGGFRPDPYDDLFNTDYTTFGGYAFVTTDLMGFSAGYALDYYQSEKDRERANAAISFMPATQSFHFNASIDMDNDFDSHSGVSGGEGWEVTNLLLDGTFRPGKMVVFGFTYNNFRAINREASSEHIYGEEVLSEASYSVTRVKVEVRPFRHYAIYGGFDMRSREIDGESANQFYGGIRNNSFYFGSRWDVRYSNMDWFTSEVTAIRGTVGLTKGKVDFDASITYMTNTQDDLDNELVQMIYEFSVYWWMTKKVYLTGMFSYSSEEYLDIDSVYTTRYDDNFTTTTLMFQAGYRF